MRDLPGRRETAARRKEKRIRRGNERRKGRPPAREKRVPPRRWPDPAGQGNKTDHSGTEDITSSIRLEPAGARELASQLLQAYWPPVEMKCNCRSLYTAGEPARCNSGRTVPDGTLRAARTTAPSKVPQGTSWSRRNSYVCIVPYIFHLS